MLLPWEPGRRDHTLQTSLASEHYSSSEVVEVKPVIILHLILQRKVRQVAQTSN